MQNSSAGFGAPAHAIQRISPIQTAELAHLFQPTRNFCFGAG